MISHDLYCILSVGWSFLRESLIWLFYSYVMRHYYTGKEYVHIIQRLGPVVMKIVQLANMKNLIPRHIQSELHMMDASPHSWEYTEQVLNQDLPYKWKFLRDNLSPHPLYCGSFSQVYKVVTDKRKMYIIKVLHPDAEDLTKATFFWIHSILYILKWVGIRPVFDMEVVEKAFMKQVSLENEQQSIAHWKNEYAFFPTIHLPEIHYASKRLLIESFEYGLPLERFCEIEPFYSCEAIQLFTNTIFHMHLKSNLFHGDPHTRNFLFTLNNGVVHIHIIDAGFVLSYDKTELDCMKKNFIVPFIYDDTLLTHIGEKYNINPLALINNFHQDSYVLTKHYKEKIQEIRKGKFSRSTFYLMLEEKRNERYFNQWLSMMFSTNIQVQSNVMYSMMLFELLFSKCFDLYLNKENMIHDIVRYGVKHGFIESNIITKKIEKQQDKFYSAVVFDYIKPVVK